jgi:MFS family permease
MTLLIEYIREFGRFQRNARLYLISNALSGITVGILLVLYNLYLVSLGYSTDFIGLVLFVGTLGAGIAIFPAGVCIDRFGGKLVLIWSNLAMGLIGIGQILFRQPIPLLVSGFIAGVVTAFFLVVNAPYLTKNSTPHERSHLFSLNIVLGLGTTVLGEVLGGALPLWFRTIPWLMAPLPSHLSWLLALQPEPRSYQLALLFAGVLAGPSLVPIFLLSNDRPHRSENNETAVADREEDGSSHRSLPSSLLARRGRTTLHLPRLSSIQLHNILYSSLFVLVLVQVLVGFGAGLFIPYFNVYFVKHLGASSALFGLIDGGANAINAVFTLLAPWLAMRIGKISTITLTRLLSIPLLLTIGLTNLLPLAATLYLFRQATMNMADGIFQVFSMEAVPEQHRGLANSTYQASYQVAWAVTTPLGGLIIAHFGYPPVFILGAVLYMLSIALLWGWFGHGKSEAKAGNEGGHEDEKERDTSSLRA